MYYEIKLFQVYLLQLVTVFCIRKWCTNSVIKTLKDYFNTSQPVDKAFSFSHSLILLSLAHPKQTISESKFWDIPAFMAHLEDELHLKTIESLLPLPNDLTR